MRRRLGSENPQDCRFADDESEGWIIQAKLAAKGEWDALDDLQDEFKGWKKEVEIWAARNFRGRFFSGLYK